MNARPVNNKTEDIGQYMTDCDSDVCCITETWLRPEDDMTPRQLTPTGYSLLQVPRPHKSGGGVAIMYKSALKMNEPPVKAYSAFEHLEALLQTALCASV